MTHYTVDYTALTGEAKREKALRDIEDYLGKERYDYLTEVLANGEGYDLETFSMIVSFAGVQGYPAKAWWEHCFQGETA